MHIAPCALALSTRKGLAFCVKRDRVVRQRTGQGTVIGPHRATEAIRAARIRAGLTLAQAAEGVADNSTVQRWEKGSIPSSWQVLDDYARRIGPTITLTFGVNDEEAAPPRWAERLLAGVMALEEEGQLSDEDVARAQARAAAYLAVAPQRQPQPASDDAASEPST